MPRRTLTKPDGMRTTTEALAELNRRGVDCSEDQLYRCGTAVFPPGELASAWGAPRFYDEAHLAFLEVALNLQSVTHLRYDHLSLLADTARQHQLDVATVFQALLDKARGTNTQQRRLSA